MLSDTVPNSKVLKSNLLTHQPFLVKSCKNKNIVLLSLLYNIEDIKRSIYSTLRHVNYLCMKLSRRSSINQKHNPRKITK